MELKTSYKLLLPLTAALSLAACNVDLNLNDEKKEEVRKSVKEEINKTFSGVITSLETLKVNGVEFDTENAKIYVNGEEVDYSELELGMLITVSGTDNQDGTGVALSIDYDQELSGVVVNNNFDADGTLDVMGQTVYINSDTVIDSEGGNSLTIEDIGSDDLIEVSGYTSGDGKIWATRLELKQGAAVDEVWEVEGVIQNSTDGSFMIGELTVSYTAENFSEQLISNLVDGAHVEVYSVDGFNDSDELVASDIEIESTNGRSFDYDSDDEELEIEGIVTAVVSDVEIEINGTSVSIDNDAIDFSTLTEGDRIEVEVKIDINGNFVVVEVEDENHDEASEDDDGDSSNNDDDDSQNNSDDGDGDGDGDGDDDGDDDDDDDDDDR